MCIIPEKEWAESWEDTLQCEWPNLDISDAQYRIVGVEVVTTHWWLSSRLQLPRDQEWREHTSIKGVTCRRDTTDGRTLDRIRFACPYEYATVVALVRELVGLGLTPTDRWSLVVVSIFKRVDQA
jgi:hypothetical protein